MNRLSNSVAENTALRSLYFAQSPVQGEESKSGQLCSTRSSRAPGRGAPSAPFQAWERGKARGVMAELCLFCVYFVFIFPKGQFTSVAIHRCSCFPGRSSSISCSPSVRDGECGSALGRLCGTVSVTSIPSLTGDNARPTASYSARIQAGTGALSS